MWFLVILGNIETKAWPDKNFDKNVMQLAWVKRMVYSDNYFRIKQSVQTLQA